MSRKTTRRRKGPLTDAHAEPRADRAADVHLGPTAPPTDAPTPPPSSRISTGDLEALASMDRSELDALMGGVSRQQRFEEGDKVTGTITRIGREHAFVDVGGKAEATLGVAELRGEQVGDTVTAFVLSAREGGVRLSRQLTGAAAAAFLDDAVASGVPVEGRVTSRNAGGFEVRIGPVRAFCPVSLIDRHPAADLDVYLDQTFRFQVIEAGDEPVLSRRALLEEEAEEARTAFFERARPGDVHQGVVTSVQPWGAFVDIGGVEGLVHRSELGWDDVVDASSRVTRGQRLEVRVLEIDREAGRVSLSAKDPNATPWGRVGVDFVEGGVYEGTVTGVERYGAFVKLAPGLQGLLHASRRTAEGLPRPGESISVRLVGVDRDRHRLELADPDYEGDGRIARDDASDRDWAAHQGAGDEQSLGTLGDLLKGLKLDR